MTKKSIKHLWLCMVCALSATTLSAMAQKATSAQTFKASHYGVTVQGACIYSESWNNLGEGELTPMGIYQMEQSDGYEIKPFLINSAVYSNAGGAFIGNDFWFIWKQRDPTGQITLCQREKLDLTTGKRENLGVCTNDLMATSAGTAVDPTTGNVYGIFWDSESMSSRELGIIDYPNGTRTTIATISQTLYALCCDKTGQLYAVTQSGKLVKVDKADGMLTEVGNTGIKPSMMQAAAIDTYTNKMYWTALYKNSNGKDEAGLYEVDLATAQATKLASYPNLDEFSTLRILAPKAKDDAPAPATDLTAVFNKAETNGTFSFKLPTESFAGTAIAGELTYKVSIDGESKATGKAEAGKDVTLDVSTSTGLHSFSVVLSNAVGDGPAASISKYTGYDKPLPPTDVKLSIDEASNKAHLSWTAPTAGVNDGYIDADNLTYNVVRHPDEKEFKGISGTTLDDELTPAKAMMYSYDVTAVNHSHKGKAATSNAVMYGNGYDVPWTEAFDNASSLNMFTIVDANNDGSTWGWSRFRTKAVTYTYNEKNAADDWLITPPIALQAGKKYKLTFDEHVTLSKYPEKLEVKYGTGLDYTSYTEVMKKTTFTNADFETQTIYVTPVADGNYHFGFHVCSDAYEGLLYIDNMAVDVEPEATAPAAASDLKASAAEYGANPVTISFKAPQNAINGTKLQSITKIEVKVKDGNAIKTFDAPTPGESLSCNDENATKGLNTYYILAYNESGAGKRAEVTAFVGNDTPAAPDNITVSGNEDGTLKLSWTAPEKGKNGGYINKAQLSYAAYTVDDDGYAELYKDNIKTSSISLADIDNTGDQRLEYFGVQAANKDGESDIMPSNYVIMGDAYTLPFADSFANGKLAYGIWYSEKTGAKGFAISDKASADNDGGCISFQAAEAKAIASFCSGKIALNGCESPVLTFDYYCQPGAEDVLLAEINRSYIDTTAVKTVDFSKETGATGWRHAVVSLQQFKSAPYIQLAFLAQIAKAGNSIMIDNIKIENNPELSVNDIMTDAVKSDKIYDLSGRLQQNGCKMQQGIYITGGKKIIVK